MFGSGELLLGSGELILGSGEKQGDGVRLKTCNCENAMVKVSPVIQYIEVQYLSSFF